MKTFERLKEPIKKPSYDYMRRCRRCNNLFRGKTRYSRICKDCNEQTKRVEEFKKLREKKNDMLREKVL